jgi:Protein of unknown function (DUF3579)
MADSSVNLMPSAPVVLEFVIRGVTLEGQPFRPSDWAERLCGVMSVFGADQRMAYSPYVQPISSAGVKCVVVDLRLKDIEPMAYTFLLNFAKDNELEVREGRKGEREESGDKEPGPA